MLTRYEPSPNSVRGCSGCSVFSHYPGTASDGIEADVVRGQFDNGLTYFPPREDLVRIGCVGKVLDCEPKASTIACVGGVDAGENVDANVVRAFPELCGPMFLADGGMRTPLTAAGSFDDWLSLFGDGDDCAAYEMWGCDVSVVVVEVMVTEQTVPNLSVGYVGTRGDVGADEVGAVGEAESVTVVCGDDLIECELGLRSRRWLRRGG